MFEQSVIFYNYPSKILMINVTVQIEKWMSVLEIQQANDNILCTWKKRGIIY